MGKLIVVLFLIAAMSLRQVARAARASDRVLSRAEVSLVNRAVARRVKAEANDEEETQQ